MVIELFVYHYLCNNAGDHTADSVIELFVCHCLYYNTDNCTVDSVVELFVCCHFYCDVYWLVQIYNCLVAAEETNCETDDSDISLKTVNSDSCSTVSWGVSSSDVISGYWY